MAREPFLINPPEVMMSGNPRRRRRRARRSMPARRRTTTRRRRRADRIGTKHRPVVYTVRGPGGRLRWKTSEKARGVKPGIFVNPELMVAGNPRRRRRRRNPVTLAQLPGQLQSVLPLAVTGIASRIVTSSAPGMIGVANPWAKIGVKTAVALVGGQFVNQMLRNDHGLVWTVVGMADVVADAVNQLMPGVLPGLSEYPDYYSEYGYGGEGVSAYPEEVSAYPEEVSQYPYDGPHEYGY